MTGPLPRWPMVVGAEMLRGPGTLLGDHLFARVVAAVGADTVRELGLATVRAERPRRHAKLPVGPALLAAGARMPSLRYGHGSFAFRRVERARRAPLRSAVGRRPGAATGTKVSVLTAARAEAGAIFLAQWSHREPQDHGFSDLSIQGEDLAVVHVDAPILLVERTMALDARVLNPSTEDLEIQRENLGKVDQASATLLQRNGMDDPPNPDLLPAAVQVEAQGQGPLERDFGRGDPDRGARNLHLQACLPLGKLPKVDLHRG